MTIRGSVRDRILICAVIGVLAGCIASPAQATVSFTGPKFSSNAGGNRSVATGDWNADGNADLATLGQDFTSADDSVKVSLGDGAGGLGAPVAYTVGYDAPDTVVAVRARASLKNM